MLPLLPLTSSGSEQGLCSVSNMEQIWPAVRQKNLWISKVKLFYYKITLLCSTHSSAYLSWMWMQAAIILHYKENTKKITKTKKTYQPLLQIQSKQVLIICRQYFAMYQSYSFILKKIITLLYLIVGDTELIIWASQEEVNVILNLLYIFRVT